MAKKNTYLALRKEKTDSVSIENQLGTKMNGAMPYSVSVMIRTPDPAGESTVLRMDGIFELGIRKEQVYLKLSGVGTNTTNSTNGKVYKNSWNQIGFTCDGSRVSLYINGNLNTSFFGSLSGVNTGKELEVGTEFAGDIRYIYIFNQCLGASELKQTMYLTPPEEQLHLWADFSSYPCQEKIHNTQIKQGKASIKSFSPSVQMFQNSYLKGMDGDVETFKTGYYGVEHYTVQMNFCFEAESETSLPYYNLLSDMGAENYGGINLYLEKEEDGYHVRFHHAYMDENVNTVISSTIIKRDIWYNIAVTFSECEIRLYVDGKLDGESLQAIPSFLDPEERQFLIGADREDMFDHGCDFFSGYVNQCDIWNCTLTEEEIRAYMGENPEPDAENLMLSLVVLETGCYNAITQCGISMLNHAAVGERVQIVTKQQSEQIQNLTAVCQEPLSKEELKSVYAACMERWHSQQTDGEISGADDMPYTVKAYRKSGMVYFVACDKKDAYTVAMIEDAGLSEEIIWWVELILILVGGVFAVLFGIRLVNKGSKTVTFIINNVLCNPAVKALFGGDMGALVVLGFMRIMYNQNLLWTFVKIACDIGVWAILGCIASIGAVALGVGWLKVAAEFAAIAVQLGVHIANKPEDSGGDLSSIVLKKVTFRNLGEKLNPDKEIESLELAIDGEHPLKEQAWDGTDKQAYAAYPADLSVGRCVCVRAEFVYTGKGVVAVKAVGTVLGESDEECVTSLPVKKSALSVIVRFPNHHFSETNLEKHAERLTWMVLGEDGQWSEIESMKLILYSLPTSPVYPWKSGQDSMINQTSREMTADETLDTWNGTMLWSRAMDCYEKLMLEQSPMEDLMILSTITQIVNAMPNYSYNPNAHYTSMSAGNVCFALTDFLNDMETANLKNVNCTDCANLVQIFASLRGIRVCTERMLAKGLIRGDLMKVFLLNPIQAIGSPNVNYNYTAFTYHEVVMLHTGLRTSPISSTHKVYDACLKLNYTATPSLIPPDGNHSALPTGMSFSIYANDLANVDGIVVNADSYREFLCPLTMQGVGNCIYEALYFGMKQLK